MIFYAYIIQLSLFAAWICVLIALVLSAALISIRQFEKKRQERNLKAELDPAKIRREYLEFMDHLQDGYVETDQQGRITYVNRPFLQDPGYEKQSELEGRFFWQLAQEKYRKGIETTFKSVFESRKPLDHFKIVYSGKEGKVTGSRGIVRTELMW